MEPVPKALIVDDDIFIQNFIETVLKKAGYQTIKACNGEEGLEKAAEEEPDVIILDVMMPKIDGIEVCRRLKSSEDTSLIPVVMLTSKDYVEDKIAGLEIGADDYITKPFNPKEFLARIKGLVDKKIYQHKRAEEEKLEALEKMVEGVAHEVRNPIVAIGGFARRIRDRLPAGDTLKVYADYITHEVERLEKMLNAVIKLKTIVVSANEPVDIKEIVDESLEDLSVSVEERQINVNKKYTPETTLILGDRKNLKEVFFNVIDNAIEAMENGGTVILEIELKEKRVFVNITDSGRGIPKSEISQVVRPFYTSKMSGAGMGLTMVKQFVHFYGGDINISSKKGEGTQVTIILPLIDDTQI